MQIELYQKTQDPNIGKQLLATHRDTIDKHIAKWSGVLPEVVIKKHADKYALDAFKTFDPKKGASIQTHLFNNLNKLSRLTYAYQNVVKIPEHQILQIGHYQNAIDVLSDKFDRNPSHEEIADYMKIPVSHVDRLSKNIRSDFTQDSDNDFQSEETIHDDKGMYLEDRLRHLSPHERQVFNDLTGYNNSKILSLQEFGKKYKLEPYQVSRVKSSLAKKFGDLNVS